PHGVVRRIARHTDARHLRHPDGSSAVGERAEPRARLGSWSMRGGRRAVALYAARALAGLHTTSAARLCVPALHGRQLSRTGGGGEALVLRALRGGASGHYMPEEQRSPGLVNGLPLESLFAPRSVAVIGASRDPSKVGGSVLANLRAGG